MGQHERGQSAGFSITGYTLNISDDEYIYFLINSFLLVFLDISFTICHFAITFEGNIDGYCEICCLSEQFDTTSCLVFFKKQ
jgi:hypothetical protein